MFTLKVAVTDKLLFIVSVQVLLVPLQAPLQPVKYDPLAAVAVSFTAVPAANDLEHVGLQLMPVGLLVTVPFPVPFTVTVRV